MVDEIAAKMTVERGTLEEVGVAIATVTTIAAMQTTTAVMVDGTADATVPVTVPGTAPGTVDGTVPGTGIVTGILAGTVTTTVTLGVIVILAVTRDVTVTLAAIATATTTENRDVTAIGNATMKGTVMVVAVTEMVEGTAETVTEAETVITTLVGTGIVVMTGIGIGIGTEGVAVTVTTTEMMTETVTLVVGEIVTAMIATKVDEIVTKVMKRMTGETDAVVSVMRIATAREAEMLQAEHPRWTTTTSSQMVATREASRRLPGATTSLTSMQLPKSRRPWAVVPATGALLPAQSLRLHQLQRQHL